MAADANDRIKRRANWRDWCLIADGLAVGRVKAMRRAKTNQPRGGVYGRAFAQWMAERPWARNINKATRNHLLWVAAHRSEIEAWRETLTQRARGRMNHPTSLRRRWDASHKPTTVREALVRELRAQIASRELRAELARLKHMIEHCDGSLFNLRRDSVDDTVDVMGGTVPLDPFESLRTEAFPRRSAIAKKLGLGPA